MTATKKQALEDTGERMVPEFHKGTLIYAEHLTRYICAQDLVKDKVVLDIASGSGYGTQLLAKSAKKVYGVDVDEQAVAYAKKHFDARNIEYRVGDGERIPLEDSSMDVVITFETIEHIKDYKRFIDEIKRVLKPDGLAVVSTPNDLEFAEGNHFHLHEFTYKELVGLLRKDFKNIDSYYQATWKYVAVGRDTQLQREGELNMRTLSLAPPKAEQYLYFYLVCSNREITEKVQPLAALGEHYSDRQIVGMQALYAETIANIEAELRGVREQYNVITTTLENTNRERDEANDRLREIIESRTYRLARMLAQAKRGLTKKHGK